MMWKIAEYYEDEGKTKKAIAETEKALALISVLSNDTEITRFQNYIDFFNGHLERMKIL